MEAYVSPIATALIVVGIITLPLGGFGVMLLIAGMIAQRRYRQMIRTDVARRRARLVEQARERQARERLAAVRYFSS